MKSHFRARSVETEYGLSAVRDETMLRLASAVIHRVEPLVGAAGVASENLKRHVEWPIGAARKPSAISGQLSMSMPMRIADRGFAVGLETSRVPRFAVGTCHPPGAMVQNVIRQSKTNATPDLARL